MPECFVTKRRDRTSAPKFLKKALKWYVQPEVGIVTEKLRSNGAATKDIGKVARQEMGRWKNSRAESSHLPLKRKERVMLRFRRVRSLRKFVSIHAFIFHHFNQGHSLFATRLFPANPYRCSC
nr:DDE-type integrase/transposase/recombinase [Shimia thalassica]